MRKLRVIGITILCGFMLLLGVYFIAKPVTADPQFPRTGYITLPYSTDNGEEDSYIYLPIVTTNGQPPVPTSNLCRLGFAGTFAALPSYPQDIVQPLRGEWLLSWGVYEYNLLAENMRLGPSIWVKQWKEADGDLVLTDYDAPYAEPYTYTLYPSFSEIRRIAASYPGQVWLVGNEIERRDWRTGSGGSTGQQEILPEVYARLYHEVYHTIKEADPTARVANGSVIMPSPLRLEYLTRMWDAYYRLYHTDMPVDVWQIHLYLMQEKRGEFGADIPAGIDDVDTGMFVFDTYTETWMVNKQFYPYVPDFIRAFRTWMKERGQQNKPLFITEMAVMVPDWIPEVQGEFTPVKIRNEFLYPALDLVFQEKDLELGYPDDDYRMVQSMWWWSFNMDYGNYVEGDFHQAYNGNLVWSGLGPPSHAPNPLGLSELGQYWVDYVAQIDALPNLRPYAIEPLTGFSADGKAITATIKLKILNNSEVAASPPFTVTFRDYATGEFIDQIIISKVVEGCGDKFDTEAIQWSNLVLGKHSLWVRVDTDNMVLENDENDNVAVFDFFVGGYQLRLPIVIQR